MTYEVVLGLKHECKVVLQHHTFHKVVSTTDMESVVSITQA